MGGSFLYKELSEIRISDENCIISPVRNPISIPMTFSINYSWSILLRRLGSAPNPWEIFLRWSAASTKINRTL